MNPLTRALIEITSLFDRLGIVYAVMGGLAVRVYGIPRATYDIDFTIAIERQPLPELFEREDVDGATLQLVSPEDLILLKLIAGRPRDIADVHDVVFIQGELDQDSMRTWAARLGVAERLTQAPAGPPSI